MFGERDVLRLLAGIEGRSITRRELAKRAAALGFSIPALTSALGAVGGTFSAQAKTLAASLQEDPASGVRGGKLTVAIVGEPPTLDEQQTTTSITADVTGPIYETLFAFDEEYQPQPMLAQSYSVSEDGLTWTIKLRQGVPFHNGELMTAADVKASMDRWGQLSGIGTGIYEKLASFDTPDDYTIILNLTAPYPTLLIALSGSTQNCSIYPKSVIEAGTLEPNEAAIGTGPYKLADRKPDTYIRLERFDDYAALPGGPKGYGGTKYAYADTIEFIPVPEGAARIAGLQAGDFLLVQNSGIGNDQYDVLKDAPGLITEINQPTDWPIFYFNWKSDLMSNLALREAVQAALNMEPMMQSAFGNADFYRLDPGLMMKQTAWWTDAGGDRYNMNNPDLAKQKLQEAGYDGTPIRFLATAEYDFMYATSTVAVQQLEAIGLKMEHQVVDWATLVDRRAKPDAWEMFVTGEGFVPDPTQVSCVGQMGTYPGWWDDPDSLALGEQLLTLSTFEERKPVWDQIQANFYTQIPAVKIGDSAGITSRSEKIGGWSPQFESGGFKYWNFWIKG